MAQKKRTGLSAKQKAVMLAKIAEGKKGKEIVVLDIKDILVITDFFVLVTGMNKRQLQTIALEMQKELKEGGIAPIHIDGYEHGWWVLLDCGDVVVHLFQKDAREYYGMENLWGDAPRLDWRKTKRSGPRKASP